MHNMHGSEVITQPIAFMQLILCGIFATKHITWCSSKSQFTLFDHTENPTRSNHPVHDFCRKYRAIRKRPDMIFQCFMKFCLDKTLLEECKYDNCIEYTS